MSYVMLCVLLSSRKISLKFGIAHDKSNFHMERVFKGVGLCNVQWAGIL